MDPRYAVRGTTSISGGQDIVVVKLLPGLSATPSTAGIFNSQSHLKHASTSSIIC